MHRDAREAIQQPRSVAAAITGCLATAPAAQTDAEMRISRAKTWSSILESADRARYTVDRRRDGPTDSGKWRMSDTANGRQEGLTDNGKWRMSVPMIPSRQSVDQPEPLPDRFVLADREAFLRELNLGLPGLTDVGTALDRGNTDEASRAYAAWFRQRRFDSPLLTDWDAVSPDPGADTSPADRLLAGRLFDGYASCEAPGGIQWGVSPLGCATRFPMLVPVCEAIHNTADPRSIRWAVDHILGYAHTYPIATFAGHRLQEGWVSHFQMAEPWYWCMWSRLQQLSHAVDVLRRYPQFSDDELLEILQRMHEEVSFVQFEIREWVGRRHNGGLGLIRDVASALGILDHFRSSAAWRASIAELTVQYLNEAFYPDGMCIELTTAYSASCSVSVQNLAFSLRETEAIQASRPRLREMVTCMVALTDPTWWLPSFGDLYAGTVDRYLDQDAVRWLEQPWADTVRKQASEGPPPPFTEWPGPGSEQWCGYYTMRSGWDPLARYMAIDGGPWGTTHQHGDKLSFVVTALGSKFIIDPSGTRYASNEPDAFVSRQCAGFLHNTITVDGVDEFRITEKVAGDLEAAEPLQNRWETREGHTLFVGDFSFAPIKPVHWQRRVVFVDRAYWFLQDVLTGNQETARVEQNFQFDTDVQIELEGDLTVATAPDRARLVLVPLSGGLQPELSVGDRDPHTTYWPNADAPSTVIAREDDHDQIHGRGWTGRGGHRLLPAPAVTYVGDVQIPTGLTVAIVPLAPGQELSDLPDITATVAAGKTTWVLPSGDNPLRAITDTDTVTVVRP